MASPSRAVRQPRGARRPEGPLEEHVWGQPHSGSAPTFCPPLLDALEDLCERHAPLVAPLAAQQGVPGTALLVRLGGAVDAAMAMGGGQTATKLWWDAVAQVLQSRTPTLKHCIRVREHQRRGGGAPDLLLVFDEGDGGDEARDLLDAGDAIEVRLGARACALPTERVPPPSQAWGDTLVTLFDMPWQYERVGAGAAVLAAFGYAHDAQGRLAVVGEWLGAAPGLPGVGRSGVLMLRVRTETARRELPGLPHWVDLGFNQRVRIRVRTARGCRGPSQSEEGEGVGRAPACPPLPPPPPRPAPPPPAAGVGPVPPLGARAGAAAGLRREHDPRLEDQHLDAFSSDGEVADMAAPTPMRGVGRAQPSPPAPTPMRGVQSSSPASPPAVGAGGVETAAGVPAPIAMPGMQVHVPDEVRERWYQHLEDEFDLCHAGLEAVISSAYAELAPLLASRSPPPLLGPFVRDAMQAVVGRLFPDARPPAAPFVQVAPRGRRARSPAQQSRGQPGKRRMHGALQRRAHPLPAPMVPPPPAAPVPTSAGTPRRSGRPRRPPASFSAASCSRSPRPGRRAGGQQ
jgi:hypothetical protein